MSLNRKNHCNHCWVMADVVLDGSQVISTYDSCNTCYLWIVNPTHCVVLCWCYESGKVYLFSSSAGTSTIVCGNWYKKANIDMMNQVINYLVGNLPKFERIRLISTLSKPMNGEEMPQSIMYYSLGRCTE